MVLECWSCRISLYDSWFGSSSVIGVLPYLGDNLWKASFVVVPQSTGGRWFLRIILANLSGKVFFFFFNKEFELCPPFFFVLHSPSRCGFPSSKDGHCFNY